MPFTLFDFKEWQDYYYKDLIQGLIKDHSVNEISSVISEELETLPKTIQKRMTKIEEKISLQFATPIKSGQSQGEMVYRVYSVGDIYIYFRKVLNKQFKVKPTKKIVDTMFSLHVYVDARAAHTFRGFRKALGIKKGFFG